MTLGSSDDDATESEESAEEWEVEEIRDYRNGLYQVKWKGWDSDDNTWEPAGNLSHAVDILKEFKRQHRAAMGVIHR